MLKLLTLALTKEGLDFAMRLQRINVIIDYPVHP
jgi:hypothetical protein